jgi:hypothetical protein
MESCAAAGHGQPPGEQQVDPKPLVKLDWKFRRIARRLKTAELRRDVATELDPDGLFAAVVDKFSTRYFLGFYSEAGVHTAFERYGFWAALAEQGLHHPVVRLDLSDPYLHCARAYCDGEAAPANLVAELRARIIHRPSTYSFGGELADDDPDFLFIEWLLLQNPRRPFRPHRLPLPSQDHPGLGLRFMVFEMVQLMAERLGLAGIVNVPMHYHNARLYKVRATFLDPQVEGRFRALLRDLDDRSMFEQSWAVHRGCVIDKDSGEPYEWHGHEQLCALRRRVRRYFHSDGFERERDQVTSSRRFAVDEARLAAVIDELHAELGI